MIHGQQAHSKCVDYPLRLQLYLGHDCCPVGPELVQHLVGIVQAPRSVVGSIQVVLCPVVYSSLSTRQLRAIRQCFKLLLGFAYFFEVVCMFFLIYIVGVFIDGEGEGGEGSESAAQRKSCHYSH